MTNTTDKQRRHQFDNCNGAFKFVTHNDVEDIATVGTYRVGHLENIDFYRIIDMFGKPSNFFDDYKSDAEWEIEFEDGLVATIYNWKNGLNYNGKVEKVERITLDSLNNESYGLQLTDITYWNVGGTDPKVVDRLMGMLHNQNK